MNDLREAKTPYSDKTDEELVLLTLSDAQLYLHIMRRYEAKLMRYVQRIISFTNEEAEDVVQETFIKTYENLNEFDTSLKFSSWIYRIAHNEAVNALRKSSRFPSLPRTDEADIIMESLAGQFDLEEEMHRKMENESVRVALNGLDEKYREVLVLKFLEDKSYEEISDILKKPVGTVGTLINRAKQKLREKIENQ